MRPHGDVRRALARALAELVEARGPVSAREAADHARVAFEQAQRTLENMRRVGEVVVAGHGKAAGERVRWHSLYEPAPRQRYDLLDAAMRRMVATSE